MEAAGSIDRFLRAPLGRWISGSSFIVWSWSPGLGGMVAWGRPSEEDIERMFPLVDAYHRVAPACDVVTDVSQLQGLSTAAFELLVAGMRQRLERYRAVPRHAVIRGRGLMSALPDGIFAILGSGQNLRAFDDAEGAFRWVREGASAWKDLRAIVDRAMAVTPEVRQLREYLAAHLRSARVPAAARALGMSERSLHRALKDAQTGFREELTSLRVEEARRLLAETDRKIDAIARAVGFASHAHLATCFRRTTGETPSEYRARVPGQRPGPT